MSRVRVSDHAVLRWLERVEGVNVDAIRDRIMVAARGGAVLQASGVRVDGVTFYLQYNRDEAVVTSTMSQHPRLHLAEPRLPPVDVDGEP